MKVFLIALGVILAVLAIPSLLFLLGSMALETTEEFYHLLVSYEVIRPKAGDAKVFELWAFCKGNNLRRECGDCPYRTEAGCGFTGPPERWSEDVLYGKRASRRRL